MKRVFAGIVFVMALGASHQVFARISVSAAPTPLGEVETSITLESMEDYGMPTTGEVSLDGQVILREEDVTSVRIMWESPPPPQKNYRLLLLNIGPAVSRRECEAMFRLMDLSKSEPPYVTARFGNCRSEPFIREKGGVVVFYFPRFINQPEGAWQYTTDGGLKKIGVTPKIRAGTW